MLQLNKRVSATQTDASMTEPYSMNTLSPEVILSTLSKSKIPMTVESIAESIGQMRHKIFPLIKNLESSGQIIRLTDDGPAQFKVAANVAGEFQMTPSPSAPAAAAAKKPQAKAASAKVVSIKKSEKASNKSAAAATKPAAASAVAKLAPAAAPVDARLKLLQAMSLSARSQDDLSAMVEDFEGVIKGLIDEGFVESDNIFNEYVYMLTDKAKAELPATVLAPTQPEAPAPVASKAAKAAKPPVAKPAGKSVKAAAVAELPKRRRGRPTKEEAARRAAEAERLGLERPAIAGQTVAAEPKAPAKKKVTPPKAPAAKVAPVAAAPAPAPVQAPQTSAPAPVLPTDLTENGEMLLQLNRVLSKLVDDQVGNLRQQNEMRKAEALEIARSLKDLSANLTQVGKNMLEISERLLKSVS